MHIIMYFRTLWLQNLPTIRMIHFYEIMHPLLPFCLSENEDSDSDDISTEAIVGIVIGGVATLIVIVIIVVAIPCSVMHKKKRKFQ